MVFEDSGFIGTIPSKGVPPGPSIETKNILKFDADWMALIPGTILFVTEILGCL